MYGNMSTAGGNVTCYNTSGKDRPRTSRGLKLGDVHIGVWGSRMENLFRKKFKIKLVT